ncbi:MAG: UDP-N-acetylmuramoyl-L-alanine--D-glutamate ligase [Nocardioides sp.]
MQTTRELVWQVSRVCALVVGFGVSGRAVHALLSAHGATVLVHEPNQHPQSLPEGAESVEQPDWSQVSLVVRSPGVPLSSEILRDAARSNVPIWGEVEVAAAFFTGPLVGITGSNGKGWTATLVASALERSGRKPILAGNIGYAFSQAVVDHAGADIAVLEISAAQLENCSRLDLTACAITNIQSEHLNLYSPEYYLGLKRRVLDGTCGWPDAVLGLDDPRCVSLVGASRRPPWWYSQGPRERQELDGLFVEQGQAVLCVGRTKELLFSVDDVAVPGLMPSALAASAIGHVLGCGPADIKDAVLSQPPRQDVIEFLGVREGVTFYNDAKSTNTHSTLHAMHALRPSSLIVIVGGEDDKLNVFDDVARFGREHEIRFVVFGETSAMISNVMAKERLMHWTEPDFMAAVQRAEAVALPGDIVLFSPGTHSERSVPSYLERGRWLRRNFNDDHPQRTD